MPPQRQQTTRPIPLRYLQPKKRLRRPTPIPHRRHHRQSQPMRKHHRRLSHRRLSHRRPCLNRIRLLPAGLGGWNQHRHDRSPRRDCSTGLSKSTPRTPRCRRIIRGPTVPKPCRFSRPTPVRPELNRCPRFPTRLRFGSPPKVLPNPTHGIRPRENPSPVTLRPVTLSRHPRRHLPGHRPTLRPRVL